MVRNNLGKANLLRKGRGGKLVAGSGNKMTANEQEVSCGSNTTVLKLDGGEGGITAHIY